ncbi:WD40 repeat-like protein [Saitoella complicata NRRL Y-17804]|uniref:Uncharacterized protein n=1 Tax=Saitoella complicata (strain BCRC 22490 / CBS 7301 / JCM 7358 / NBRC 10748 / NRRL Y-17804) TaxID=698492 RepID=A0A0E9N7X9_SAICN|nr:WD40 repeat-like protein [Saitoella complicata NRRL Y-17804]ODQ54434.1 WD40 repeat-like protein [Saitoella complicata NRRL Y-17804]GAO45893.1 hypothetical protein G7K_0139-t1 [Saitoella complicata NRRL Y-17804]
MMDSSPVRPVKHPLDDITNRLPITPDHSPLAHVNGVKRQRLSPGDRPAKPVFAPVDAACNVVGRRRKARVGLEFGRSLGVNEGRFDLSAPLRTAALNYYSTPDWTHHIHAQENENDHSIPFAVSSCNTNSLVAIADETGSVRLLDTDPSRNFREPVLHLQLHNNAIFDLSWSADDALLATASGDQTSAVFDVQRQVCVAGLMGHTATVKQILFNPTNPALLSTCSRDGNIHLWDLRCTAASNGGTAFQKPVNSVLTAHATPQQRASKKKLPPTSITSLAYLPNGNVVSASESNSCLKVWDVRRLHPRTPIITTPAPASQSRPYGITSMNMAPNGQMLYALSRDGALYRYDTSFMVRGPIDAGWRCDGLAVRSYFVKSQISRDGNYVACGSSDNNVVLFPTAGNGSAGVTLKGGHLKEVTSVAFSGVDNTLMSVSDDMVCRLWREGLQGEAGGLRNAEEGARWGWGWST